MESTRVVNSKTNLSILNVENRRGLIGSSPNMESFIFLVWDIRTYNFRDILYINEVTFKISQNYDKVIAGFL